MNICISGGLGFIGSRLARKYAEAGHRVRVLDNAHPQIHPSLERAVKAVQDIADVVLGDVRNAEDWDKALKDADTVLHMAAETGTGQSMDKVVGYCDVNVTGTAQLGEALFRHPSVATVFLPSSRAIYGEGAYICEEHGIVHPKRRTRAEMERGEFKLRCSLCEKIARPQPTQESFAAAPVSVYASTKLAQEHVLAQTCENLGRDLRIARYQNVYGPGQSLNNPYTGVLAIFARQILQGNTLDIYEDGQIARDFVFIDDVVDGTMRLLGLPQNPGPVNIGTGAASSLTDIVSAFAEAFARDVPYEITGHFRYGDIRFAAADMTRATTAGIRPAVGLREGIGRLTQWANQEMRSGSIAS